MAVVFNFGLDLNVTISLSIHNICYVNIDGMNKHKS